TPSVVMSPSFTTAPMLILFPGGGGADDNLLRGSRVLGEECGWCADGCRRRGSVAMAGRSHQVDGVRAEVVSTRSGVPAGGLLGVVACLAQPSTVIDGGLPALGVGSHVVDVPD